MIDWLIFSKNRPLQLDALLGSIERNVKTSSRFTVLFTGDLEDYWQVSRGHNWAFWLDERSVFEERFRFWLDEAGDLIGFLTDDSLFYREALAPTGLPFAYRVGLNTVRCETLGVDQEPPATLTYEWAGRAGDFGYPLSVDGTVYEKRTILPLIDFAFRNPTELEAGLAARADRFEPKLMHMAELSSLIVFAHTRVSESSGCPTSGLYTSEDLAAHYRAGRRIRPELMRLDQVESASTMTIPYVIA